MLGLNLDDVPVLILWSIPFYFTIYEGRLDLVLLSILIFVGVDFRTTLIIQRVWKHLRSSLSR